MSITPEPSREGRVAEVDACEGAGAAPCSELYKAPVPFQGRSLEGAPGGDDRKELARSLDAELPVEDLLPVEPHPDDCDMKSIVICDPARDVTEDDGAFGERRKAYAKYMGTRAIPGRNSARFGVFTRAQARKAAVGRWAALASANRFGPVSFSDGPRRILTLVEHEAASCPNQDEKGDSYRSVDLPNTPDQVHAAHYVPELRGSKPDCDTGFGRVSADWSEPSISCRERILNALSRDEFTSLALIATLESDVEGRRAACGLLPSSQYREMLNLVADASSAGGHLRRPLRGSRGRRFRQLVEMLDHAAVVV